MTGLGPGRRTLRGTAGRRWRVCGRWAQFDVRSGLRPTIAWAELGGVDNCRVDEVVGAVEGVHVAAGGREELGSQQGPDAGHAGDHFRVPVLAKPALDELVGLGNLLVEGHHLPCEGVHDLSGDLLAGNGGVLVPGGLDGCGGELVGAVDLAVAQARRPAA